MKNFCSAVSTIFYDMYFTMKFWCFLKFKFKSFIKLKNIRLAYYQQLLKKYSKKLL